MKHKPSYYKHDTKLFGELEDLRQQTEKHAREYGLDFFETIFEVLDWQQLNEVAAYGGFPNRYPHWRFGMEYEQLSKSYEYGLSKIYEMVINNDPCYAYLLHSNAIVDQKTVMAHVYAHCDFFKNNVYFAHTNRKMMDEMANHRTRVQRHMERYGYECVEKFIDSCLSLETLIDCHSPAIRRRSEENEEEARVVKKLRVEHSYMDKFINPSDFLNEQRENIDREVEQDRKFPSQPERDVMLFLLEHAPLERWERDVLSVIREEAYYFAPQGQTKIMNEGWAVFFHSKIMTEKMLKASEVIDYAEHNAGVLAMQPGSFNPYKIGVELLRDIEDRWNKGKFGKEYEDCTDMVQKKNWNKNLGLGRKKIFEVRRLYNDVNFIDTFLTPEFCADQKMFVFSYNVSADQFELATREFQKIKQQLLFQLTNFGRPIICVEDGNYKNRNELLLKHSHEGVDMKIDFARETMKNLFALWRHPVHLETIIEGVPKIFSYDGENFTEARV